VVASCSFDHSLEGKSIREINVLKRRKKKLKLEIETILDLMAQGGASMVYHSMSDKDVERIMRHPNTAVGSDGASASSAWACRIRAPTGPMPACWPSTCATAACSS
jgi:N-acyl-D-aspartate/D-glutamate deacylase